jgi:pimeloyl-ACP methyl ester carboxylesterase
MTGPVSLALLPGLLCDGALWQAQVEALRGRADCRVADFTSQDSIAGMAESVLDMMPARFAMAGLSMGGYVAFEVMRRAPERVTRLALLDTKARPDTPAQTRRRRGLLALAERGRFKGVTPKLLPQLIHPARLGEAELPAAVIAMAERIGRAAFLGQQKAIMGRPDSLPTLVRVTCPTLVLCGRQDALTPPDCHREMAAGIARSRLLVLEDCGHLVPMERPAEVTAALEAWLTAE